MHRRRPAGPRLPGSPELTADRFVRLADGTPVYRTGDLVRPLPGGSYEFQTRLDDQVKILGHRVEPAEVAQALRAHPFVADAVVLPRTTGDRKALAAYVVRAPGADHATAEALTAHLAKSLPAYLVPAATVFVDAIPQNMNGKTDPSRLPDPFARDHSGEQERPRMLPRTTSPQPSPRFGPRSWASPPITSPTTPTSTVWAAIPLSSSPCWPPSPTESSANRPALTSMPPSPTSSATPPSAIRQPRPAKRARPARIT